MHASSDFCVALHTTPNTTNIGETDTTDIGSALQDAELFSGRFHRVLDTSRVQT